MEHTYEVIGFKEESRPVAGFFVYRHLVMMVRKISYYEAIQ